MAKTEIRDYIDGDADVGAITDEILEDVIRCGANGITEDTGSVAAVSMFWEQATKEWNRHKAKILFESARELQVMAVEAGVFRFTLTASNYYDGLNVRAIVQWHNIDEPDEIEIYDITTFAEANTVRRKIKRFKKWV